MEYHNINIKQIDYFMAVAKYLNFTKAANSLYVSQPALSKQVALLEKEIGVQLFSRNKRYVTLTEAGKILYNRLGPILSEVDDAIEEAKMVSQGLRQEIRIGCHEGIDNMAFLISCSDIFKESYPNVKISYEKQSFKEIRTKMISGELDLAVTYDFEMENLQGFAIKEVWQADICVIVSNRHPKANMSNLTLSDFKDEDFIMISRDESPHGVDMTMELCNKYGFTPRITRFVPNVESLLFSVQSNAGIAVSDTNITFVRNEKLVKHILKGETASVVAAYKSESENSALEEYVNLLL